MGTNLRRYKFNFGNVISYGAGITGDTKEYSILDGFTFTSGNTVCEYPTITTSDLTTISTSDYKKRIRDLLYEINVENPSVVNNLLEDSQIENPDGILCKLNNEFLVYSFFDGVRVIDVGEAIGVLEYKAFPDGELSDNYDWQKDATFLGLNKNKTYIFQVRDILNGNVRCSVEKRVSLPLLVPSTTIIPSEISISLNTTTNNSSNNGSYKSGSIKIAPELINNETVSISYTMSANASDGSESFVKLCCTPNGSTTHSIIESISNLSTNPTVSGNVSVNSGDVISYSLDSESTKVGSNGFALFQINNATGNGTTNPTIDIAKCCVSVSSSIATFNTVVNLTGETSTAFSNYCKRCGSIYLNPEIPLTTSVDVDVKTCVITENGGSGYVRIRCKPNGETIFNDIIYNTQSCTQPQTAKINIKTGDEVIFNTDGSYSSTNTNSSGCAIIELIDSSGSSGVGTTISDVNFIDSVSKSNEPKSVVVSVCRQNLTESGSYGYSANGFINISPILSGPEVITLDVDIVATVSDSNAEARTVLYCKAKGASDFVPLFEYNNQSMNTVNSEQLKIKTSDVVCYSLQSNSYVDWVTGTSSIKLTNISGDSSLLPTINTTKDSDSIISDRTGAPVPINVALTGETVAGTNKQNNYGTLVFDPEIPSTPSNNYIDVEFTTNASSCLNATSCVIIECVATNTEIFRNTNRTSQIKVVRMTPGDEIRYCLGATCDNTTLNSCGCASISISGLETPSSILPSINSTCNCATACAEKEARTIVVGLDSTFESTICDCGLFNLSENLGPSDRITVNYNAYVEDNVAATAKVQLFCRAYGESSYSPLMELFSSNDSTCNGSFDIGYEDSICYEVCAEQFNVAGSSATASLNINSLSGNLGINPIIDSNNCCKIISVTA